MTYIMKPISRETPDVSKSFGPDYELQQKRGQLHVAISNCLLNERDLHYDYQVIDTLPHSITMWLEQDLKAVSKPRAKRLKKIIDEIKKKGDTHPYCYVRLNSPSDENTRWDQAISNIVAQHSAQITEQWEQEPLPRPNTPIEKLNNTARDIFCIGPLEGNVTRHTYLVKVDEPQIIDAKL